VDARELLHLYDLAERIRAEFPDMRREATASIVRHVPLAPRTGFRSGFVLYSRLDEHNVDEAIDEQVRSFVALGADFEWKVYAHDRPPDLRQRLAARGFDIDEAEAIMALELAAAPPELLAPVKHDVRLLDDPDQLDDLIAVQRAVWQREHSGLAGYLRDIMIARPERMAAYVAYADGQPVAAAWLNHDARSPFASLWGGSTVATHRGQGFYGALLAVRVQESIRRGARYLTIDANANSQPIVARFGFVHLTTAWACNWQAAIVKR
jgi:GNAT superfamily N-acetyltransferase